MGTLARILQTSLLRISSPRSSTAQATRTTSFAPR
ncbi:unnamed protein product [Linum tenue]|uniref:Uncharacterized protein n=1 Tax=Linum tenue TaxID=586396 RepID=A0AAV0QR58_9ROSI|nr:unnamed protein product [Linum tenue]